MKVEIKLRNKMINIQWQSISTLLKKIYQEPKIIKYFNNTFKLRVELWLEKFNQINKIQIIIFFSLFIPISLFSTCNIVNGKKYGNCKNIRTNIIPYISSVKTVEGMISGAHILSGGILFLNGMSNGNIIVDNNGKLIVQGTVNGTITNNGGIVIIDGTSNMVIANSGLTTISGIVLSVIGNGELKYKVGAIINGKPIE